MRISTLFEGLLLTACFSAAQASTVNLDTWYQFGFDANGGPALSCVSSAQRCLLVPDIVQAGDPLWTLPGPLAFDVTLTVTDAFETIDLFEIVNDGQVVAGAPPAAGNLAANAVFASCTPLDPMTCVMDPNVQSLSTVFKAGSPIAFNILVTQVGVPLDGSAFFILSGAPAAVPEPSTWMLVGAGLALAALRRRR